ncbi:MAG: COX15/CtaA family protein [Acidobacteriota bacterium]|nr:COX15/CtaA family protein [Blastocatellia bacterium]MDW8413107.1 COX15/CtaA family protein [Acidobacteriota bacterium]
MSATAIGLRKPYLVEYSWLVLIYNVGVIVWGAYVRATGSGAGCGSHWPLCNGEVVPRSPQMQTLIEFTHRSTSGLALLLVFGLAWWVYRSVPTRLARGAAFASVFFILAEAAIGAGLVLLGLVGNDTSMMRAAYLSVHLVNTFLLVATLALTAWFVTYPDSVVTLKLQTAVMAAVGVLMLVLVGVSGAITALGDTLFPARSLAEGIAQDFSPASHLFVKLRIWHPIAAVVAGLCVSLFAIGMVRDDRRSELRWLLWITVLLVLVQIFVGLVNVALLAPVWLQLIHLALADALWASYVLLSVAAMTNRPSLQTL